MPAPLVDIHLTRNDAASTMAEHVHTRASFGLVLAGDYEERILGRAAKQAAGDLLFRPAFEPHAQAFGPQGAATLFLTATPASLDYLGEHMRVSDPHALRSPRVFDLGRRIMAELALADPFSPAALEGLSWEVLALFARGVPSAAPTAPWLKAARDHLDRHIERPTTLSELAALVGQTPADLSGGFRRAFGCTVGDYQRDLRTTRALDLIQNSRTPLIEIAVACGFCDQSHLNRVIKAHTGVTPLALRRGS